MSEFYIQILNELLKVTVRFIPSPVATSRIEKSANET